MIPELDAERAQMEHDLAEEHARTVAERAREEPPFDIGGEPYEIRSGELVPRVSDFAPSSEDEEKDIPPSEPIAFQAEPVPSDAEVLRDVAHLLERGGEPYGWIPNRLRTIADRLKAMEAGPGWP